MYIHMHACSHIRTRIKLCISACGSPLLCIVLVICVATCIYINFGWLHLLCLYVLIIPTVPSLCKCMRILGRKSICTCQCVCVGCYQGSKSLLVYIYRYIHASIYIHVGSILVYHCLHLIMTSRA